MAHRAKPRVMSERKWLSYRQPLGMLKFLRRRVSHRKRRLFAVACCRRIWPLLADERVREAIEASEAFADGTISNQERRRIAKLAESGFIEARVDATLSVLMAYEAARCAVHSVERTATFTGFALTHQRNDRRPIEGRPFYAHTFEGFQAEMDRQQTSLCDLLREIVYPFVDAAIEPAWQSANAIAMARTIYADRSYELLPILADALMDSGCDHAALLDHCRSAGPHVRGCWAVDLILGKE